MTSITNAINNTVGASNSGQTNTLLVQNPSNTASSEARINISTGGATAGDPHQVFSVTGGNQFVQGIRNNSSDDFVLATGSDLGTAANQVFRAVQSTGAAVFGEGTSGTNDRFTIRHNVASGAFGATSYNLRIFNSNAVTGGVNLSLAKEAASTGDLTIQLEDDTSSTPWTFGSDTNDSNAFKIARVGGTPAFSSNIYEKITTDGEVTFPATPAFLAFADGTQTNLPINSNTIIELPTEIFDQNGDFAANTFTAPVTGKYLLSFSIFLENIDNVSTIYNWRISTSNRDYVGSIAPNTLFSADPTRFSKTVTVLADMDASDTADIRIQISNDGASQADVSANTFFSGTLQC